MNSCILHPSTFSKILRETDELSWELTLSTLFCFVCLCLGLTTRRSLWIILSRLPGEGRKEIEEIVEEMKERAKEERGKWKKVKEQKK